MKTMSSKPRSPEAERLERDYLERLHRALDRTPEAEATEIEENIADHIHSALAETEIEEVRLSRMAVVLEELGGAGGAGPETAR